MILSDGGDVVVRRISMVHALLAKYIQISTYDAVCRFVVISVVKVKFTIPSCLCTISGIEYLYTMPMIYLYPAHRSCHLCLFTCTSVR